MIILDTDRPVLSKAKFETSTDRATPTRFVRRGQQCAGGSTERVVLVAGDSGTAAAKLRGSMSNAKGPASRTGWVVSENVAAHWMAGGFTYIRWGSVKRNGSGWNGRRPGRLVYSRETAMPKSNRDPSTPETGEQVPARPHDSGSQANETVDGLDAATERYGTPQKTDRQALILMMWKRRRSLTVPISRRKSE
jgi:hypothetical protein